MFIDIIRYKLAEGKTQEDLKDVAEKVYEGWMSKLDGFKGWSSHTVEESDGEYVDLVYWENAAAAKAANENMAENPAGEEWMACYDMTSIKADRATEIFSYKK